MFVVVFDLKQCKFHNAYHNVIWSVLEIIANVMRYFEPLRNIIFILLGTCTGGFFSKTVSKHSRRFDA